MLATVDVPDTFFFYLRKQGSSVAYSRTSKPFGQLIGGDLICSAAVHLQPGAEIKLGPISIELGLALKVNGTCQTDFEFDRLDGRGISGLLLSPARPVNLFLEVKRGYIFLQEKSDSCDISVQDSTGYCHRVHRVLLQHGPNTDSFYNRQYVPVLLRR